MIINWAHSNSFITKQEWKHYSYFKTYWISVLAFRALIFFLESLAVWESFNDLEFEVAPLLLDFVPFNQLYSQEHHATQVTQANSKLIRGSEALKSWIWSFKICLSYILGQFWYTQLCTYKKRESTTNPAEKYNMKLCSWGVSLW